MAEVPIAASRPSRARRRAGQERGDVAEPGWPGDPAVRNRDGVGAWNRWRINVLVGLCTGQGCRGRVRDRRGSSASRRNHKPCAGPRETILHPRNPTPVHEIAIVGRGSPCCEPPSRERSCGASRRSRAEALARPPVGTAQRSQRTGRDTRPKDAPRAPEVDSPRLRPGASSRAASSRAQSAAVERTAGWRPRLSASLVSRRKIK